MVIAMGISIIYINEDVLIDSLDKATWYLPYNPHLAHQHGICTYISVPHAFERWKDLFLAFQWLFRIENWTIFAEIQLIL